MKSKKISCGILSVSLSLILVMATCVIGFAKTEPTITHCTHQSLKLGEVRPDVEPIASNLDDYITDPNDDGYYTIAAQYDWFDTDSAGAMEWLGGWGGYEGTVITESVHEVAIHNERAIMYIPGTYMLYPYIYYYNDSGAEYGVVYRLDPVEVFTVEEPIIVTNAPQFAAANVSINFTSELTNVALQNKKVADYINYVGTDPLAYQPSVEIIEGQDIVAQSDQDYTNILSSFETLSFTGTGIVKLKVKYNQLDPYYMFSDPGREPVWYLKGDYYYDREGNPLEKPDVEFYSPETTVTIYVSENGEADVSLVKEDLNNTLTQAQALNAADYTAESYEAVAAAMEKANAVLNDPNATAEEVLAAKTELETAVNNLQTGTTSSADNNSEKSNGQSGSTTETVQIPKTGKSGFAVVDIALLGVVSSASYFVIRRKRKHK